MKFAQEIFPKGTFKGQKSDGGYIDGTLADNLDIYARKIADDMHFLIIITGNDGVGNGKTTMATQAGSYLTWKINQLHGTKNTFTSDNMHFRSVELEEKTSKAPKFSVHVLDEGDDLTTNWMKQTTQNLKKYFRKCRQLNQVLILILPSFFELPKFFALSRSHCLINVKFLGNFERGYFDFYGPKSKKLLYLKGKKEWDYDAYSKDFPGQFVGSYCFFPDVDKETNKYKAKKYRDMVDTSQKKKIPTERDIKAKIFTAVYTILKDISIKRLANAFGISERTGNRYISDSKSLQIADPSPESDNKPHIINNPIKEDDVEGVE